MSIDVHDTEVYTLIRKLVAEGKLDERSSAYTIAMRVVDRGISSLTEMQLYVYEKKVLSLFPKHQQPSHENR